VIVDNQGVKSPKDVNEIESQFWISLKASHEVFAQSRSPAHDAVAVIQQLECDRRRKRRFLVVVSQDSVQIVTVPSRDPRVAKERDPDKLLAVMRELDELLAGLQQQARKRAASASPNSSPNQSRAS
jgi:hypothetical protein